MAQRVILAFGGSATWIRKPLEALASHARVIAVTPKDPLVWFRDRAIRSSGRQSPPANFKAASLLAPFGWASSLAGICQPALWRRALASNELGERDVQAVFVASPHYFPLVRAAIERVPVYYYAVDSYRDYPGWNARAMAQAERNIVCAASPFVLRVGCDGNARGRRISCRARENGRLDECDRRGIPGCRTVVALIR
jgi:hypothetical protein